MATGAPGEPDADSLCTLSVVSNRRHVCLAYSPRLCDLWRLSILIIQITPMMHWKNVFSVVPGTMRLIQVKRIFFWLMVIDKYLRQLELRKCPVILWRQWRGYIPSSTRIFIEQRKVIFLACLSARWFCTVILSTSIWPSTISWMR